MSRGKSPLVIQFQSTFWKLNQFWLRLFPTFFFFYLDLDNFIMYNNFMASPLIIQDEQEACLRGLLVNTKAWENLMAQGNRDEKEHINYPSTG